MIKARVVKPGSEQKAVLPKGNKKLKKKRIVLSKNTRHILFCSAISAGAVFLYFAFNAVLYLLNKNWYNNLNKPNFYPPNFVLIVFLITTAGILICLLFNLLLKHSLLKNKALIILFIIFLGIGITYSIFFFVFHLLFISFIFSSSLFAVSYLTNYETKKLGGKIDFLSFALSLSILVMVLFNLFFVFVN